MPKIFEIAGGIVHQILTRYGRYNAVHVRRNEFQFKEVWIPMKEVAENVQNLLSPDMPLFIATDVKEKSEFEEFKSVYRNQVLFLSDFDTMLEGINVNWFGMIDQVICTAAERFVGTDLSTFSANIVRMRGFMEPDVAPDKLMYVNTDKNSGIPYIDGWRTFALWVPNMEHILQWKGAYSWARDFFPAWVLPTY